MYYFPCWKNKHFWLSFFYCQGRQLSLQKIYKLIVTILEVLKNPINKVQLKSIYSRFFEETQQQYLYPELLTDHTNRFCKRNVVLFVIIFTPVFFTVSFRFKISGCFSKKFINISIFYKSYKIDLLGELLTTKNIFWLFIHVSW